MTMNETEQLRGGEEASCLCYKGGALEVVHGACAHALDLHPTSPGCLVEPGISLPGLLWRCLQDRRSDSNMTPLEELVWN